MQIVIAGGGPAGATCARTLARLGIRAVLIEASPDGNKPCAGGLPSMLFDKYQIPELLIRKRVTGVMFQAPSGLRVDAKFADGQYIATVDRREFDGHLRWAAEDAGAIVVRGRVLGHDQKGSQLLVRYLDPEGHVRTTEADFLVGADGAWSRIAKQAMGARLPMVVAIQEEIIPKAELMDELGDRCIFNYSPSVSPDYYGWIFPKTDRVSVGVGTKLTNRDRLYEFLAHMKELHSDLLDGGEIIGKNGGMIPKGQYKEYGSRRVLLAGDSAGMVLPACGEGIYFAMRSGEIAAETISVLGATRPDILVTRYTDLVKAEFRQIFSYFTKIERIAYRSEKNREVLVRLAQDKFMARKILSAFATKDRIKTPIFKKIAVMFKLMAIRFNVAMSVSKEPDVGKD